MKYNCLGCDPEEDIQNLYDERDAEWPTTYIKWGGCGHEFHLGGRSDKDIKKQREKMLAQPRRDHYKF